MTMSDSSFPDPAVGSAWLGELIARAKQADGQPPFSDQSLVELRTGARELIAIDETAAALASPHEAELVVDPDARGRGLGTALVETLLARSPGELLVWAHGDHPAARALAATFGFERVRTLLHLRRELPTLALSDGENGAKVGSSGTFRPGADEDEWLRLNARAFADHPEQGRVTRADLDELMREPWFDPGDFLVLRDGDTMVGYCWLKIEGDTGEFYVVGIDPDRQGEGLGRRLAEAGLTRMRERGIHSAHLYVEAESTAAVALYRSLGFTEDTIDVQYARRP